MSDIDYSKVGFVEAVFEPRRSVWNLRKICEKNNIDAKTHIASVWAQDWDVPCIVLGIRLTKLGQEVHGEEELMFKVGSWHGGHHDGEVNIYNHDFVKIGGV
mgnify:FL=1|tara:strand:+ start:3265 stop:3570 length:306 start_codon:yes stop_codon:yes gene_type:complete